MFLVLLTTFSCLSSITCTEVNITSTENPSGTLLAVTGELFGGESIQDTVKGEYAFNKEKATITKKGSGCSSGNCQDAEEVKNSSSVKGPISVKRYKFANTPPKSLNFIASLPNVATPGVKTTTEKISIYQLSEKGKSIHDWPMEYEYEMVKPDYKMDEEFSDGDYKDGKSIQSHLDHTTSESSMNTKTTKKLKIPITLSNKIVTKNNKLIGFSKFFGNFQPFTESLSKVKITNRAYDDPQLTNGKKYDSTSSYLKNHGKHNKNRFPFGHTKLNKSFHFEPYPIYFSAAPIVRNNSFVIPVPYFVLKPQNFNKTLNVSSVHQEEMDDYNDLNISDFKIPQFEKGSFKIDPHIEISYEELEDEDYEPTTLEYDDYDETHDIDLTTQVMPSMFTIPLTITTQLPEPNRTNTLAMGSVTPLNKNLTFPFTFTTKKYGSKYPNPYVNGTIYLYYDCSDSLDAADNLQIYNSFNICLVGILLFIL